MANTEYRSTAGGQSIHRETESNIQKIAAIEESARADRGVGERIAEAITRFCGSMTFVYVHVVWFSGWIVLNSVFDLFDPFPFTFLTLVVSLEAIFLSTFILITQNQETRLTERRNHLDLQINMLAEQESTKTLELVQMIAERLGLDCDNDPTTKALLEPVDPDQIVQQILSTNGEESEAEKTKNTV